MSKNNLWRVGKLPESESRNVIILSEGEPYVGWYDSDVLETTVWCEISDYLVAYPPTITLKELYLFFEQMMGYLLKELTK